MIYTTS